MSIEEVKIGISPEFSEYTKYRYYTKLYIYIMSISGFISLILLASYQPENNIIHNLGDVFNIMSAIFCIIQWTPQIYETYKCKGIGSLSLLTLSMQTPGSFIIFVYQYVINKSRFSVGGPFLVSGVQMLILTCMGFYYEYRYRREGYFEIASY